MPQPLARARLRAAHVLVLCLICTAAYAAADAVQDRPSLTDTDCAKCHISAPDDIASGGMAHRTEVACQDCHAGHPPAEMEIIPACADCHDGESHYELPACLSCHTNPHTPLAVSFAKDVTAPCLTCHQQQGQQLNDFESFHSSMDCSACHHEHRQVPECTGCHDGHDDDMAEASCALCHQAHMPLEVAYADTTPSHLCAGCHDDAFELLAANTTLHRDLSCARCHPATHPTVPECSECHGTPHPAGIRAKFPRCGDCHNVAHDLNHWDAEAPAGQ